MSSVDSAPDEQEEQSIEQVLDRLSLSDYKETFAKEQVDLETLVRVEDRFHISTYQYMYSTCTFFRNTV